MISGDYRELYGLNVARAARLRRRRSSTLAAPFPFAAVWHAYLLQLCRMHHASRPSRDRNRWAARAGEFAADDESPAAWLARTSATPDSVLLAALDRRAEWLVAMEPFFDRFDALLMPPTSTAALRHDPRG